MKNLYLLLQISTILALGFCAPHQTHDDQYEDLDGLNQETEKLQQSQDHEDLLEDYQQQSQSEDLHQLQQGLQSGRLENFDTDSEGQQHEKEDLLSTGYEQQSQAEEINQFPEQLGQLKLEEPIADIDDTQQTHDHEDILKDLQQEAHSEDLHQYQAQNPALHLSGRYETFYPKAEDDDQQAKEEDTILGGYEQQSHVEELNQFPEQEGQIRAEEINIDADATQQTQDHGNLFDDSQQRTYNEELNQYGQEQVVTHPKSGRLEDLGEESEIFQQSQIQDGHNEELNQQHEEDLSQYTQEQEPKIPKLQISQLRHEQQPEEINEQLREEINIPEQSQGSFGDNYDSFSQEKVHENTNEQSPINKLHSESEKYEFPHIPTAAPSFWEKLKHKTKSIYNDAKDAGKKFVHHVKEKYF